MSDLDRGSVVGRYTIVREIGRGGMCLVYEGRHRDLQKTVAIKILKAEYRSQPEVVERFLREGRAASRIRHRHAIDVVDVGEHEGLVYMAMEFLQGEDLSQRIKAGGALSERQAADILLPAMAAIVEAHGAGVVHRDLKPANIFLAKDRHGAVEPKVLDFGISKLTDDDGQHQTATESMLGTPAYMAPEQIRSARYVTPASDQYSLGVILYQCLTQRLPFRGANVYETLNLVLQGSYVAPCALRPTLPAPFEAVIVRAMALDPSQRFGSVAEMGAALLPFASASVQAQWAVAFGAAREDPDASRATPGARSTEPPAGSSSAGTITSTAREKEAPVAASPSLRRRALGVVVLLALGVAAGVVGMSVWRPSPPSEGASVRQPARSSEPPRPATSPRPLDASVTQTSTVVADVPARPTPSESPPRANRVRARRVGVGAPAAERAPSGGLIVR